MNEKKNSLKKSLGLLDVFCIATGAMISSGLFVLPGIAHALAGPAVIISYMLAGLLATAGMFSQAELVSAMPKAGGTYFYVTRSMGPALGTIDGLLTWFSISMKSTFALVGMAAFTEILVSYDPRIVALFFLLVFLAINFIGIKEAGKVQVAIVLLLLVLLAVYIFKGIFYVKAGNYSPFFPYGVAAVFSTAGFVFVSYGGLLKVASIAEEVKDPSKTVPLGMMLSLLTVGILYCLVVFVTSGVLGAEQLDHSLKPISDGAAVFMGRWGIYLMGIGAILAFISTANAGIMSASRYPLALSRDRLLPDVFSRVNKRFKTPGAALLATGVFMMAGVFLDLTLLVKVASTVLILTFIFSSVCVIIMRESKVRNYQPVFRAPFYPWTQIIGIFGSWLLIVNLGKEALFVASLLFGGGLLVYWFYGKERGRKDFALLHLIERVAAREFIDVSLEAELREIIRERDVASRDRFDGIVDEAIVIDIEEEITAEDFFEMAAKKIAPVIDSDPHALLKLFLDREEQSSTVLSPGLAIPHIVVDGDHRFMLLLVRCKGGIIFPASEDKVHTIFVIVGTRDERSFHLAALSAIAQIVQDQKFEEKWMSAKDTETLRDIILLGKRKRT